MTSNEYECAMCHNVYEKGWTEEEARAESESYWPDLAQQDMAVVCDDCWQKVHPDDHLVEYQHSLVEAGIAAPLSLEEIIEMFRIPPAFIGEVDNLHGHENRETSYKKRFGL